MNKKSYNVEVLVNGRKAQEFQKDGMTFIRGDEGTQYQIRVTNNSNNRILARITVDGRSVLTDDKDDESGYIINGNDSLKLKGFRLSDDEVSTFVFSRKGDSRAQKRFGYAKDCGVIGVQVLKERNNPYGWEDVIDKLNKLNRPIETYPTYLYYPTYPWTGDPIPYYGPSITCNNNTFKSNIDCNLHSDNLKNVLRSEISYSKCSVDEPGLYSSTFDMGTSMGDIVKAPIERVEFETEDDVDATFEIYYASYQSLKKNNIVEKPKAKAYIPKPNYCKKV